MELKSNNIIMASTLTTCATAGQGSANGQQPQHQRLVEALSLSAIGRTATVALPNAQSSSQLLAAAINAEQHKMLQLAALQQQQQQQQQQRMLYVASRVPDTTASDGQISSASVLAPREVYLSNNNGHPSAERESAVSELQGKSSPTAVQVKPPVKKVRYDMSASNHPRTTSNDTPENNNNNKTTGTKPAKGSAVYPESEGKTVEWTPELDIALRQLDNEHCGDWKRIGLRMNLHPSLCRQRLEVLIKQDEASKMSDQEREIMALAKERRLRRESEILSKSERSKFFRTLRQSKKRKGDEFDAGKDGQSALHSLLKKKSKATVELLDSDEDSDKDGVEKTSKQLGGEDDSWPASSTPGGSKNEVKPEEHKSNDDSNHISIEVTDSESAQSECKETAALGETNDSPRTPTRLTVDVDSCRTGETSSGCNSDEGKVAEEPISCPNSGLPVQEQTETKEYEGARLASAHSPRYGDIGMQEYTQSEAVQRYRKGFFFRVTKMLPGKKKESLGFIALPKDTTFAKARNQMTYELDLDDSWVFFLPSLGPVSRRQESSLGTMVSWLTVKHKDMPGSRRNPIDIIIVNRR